MPENSTPPDRTRLLELDALRGLAAIATVFYHCVYRYDRLFGHEGLPVQWSYWGHYGVHLFFIISGFVIFWTLRRVERPFDFVVSRFSRLYPVYWLAVALSFTVITLAGLPGREVSARDALVNLLMFHSYLSVPSVDGVYWSLVVELTFYGWIFCVYLTGQLRNAEYALVALILVNVASAQFGLDVPHQAERLLMHHYAPLFLAGICFFHIAHGEKVTRSWLLVGFALVAVALLRPFREVLVVLVLFVIFHAAVTGRLAFLSRSVLIRLGALSYSLYLIHQNIGYIIINFGYRLGLPGPVSIAVAIVLVLCLSWLMYTLVEQPALKWIRKKYREFRPRNMSLQTE
ncbi:MAG: hypothetical protein CSB44_12925 [Gammaproteobacteria bacterium]|nr:MAG: hypothetical protein CSB44_12925 [Gammaproteobacteria bacterium]